jgi:beta-galactosidase
MCIRDRIWNAHYVWAGREGEIKDVLLLTNADTAALSLNGELLETRTVDETCMAVFHVAFHVGTLKAVCGRGGETVSDSLITPGKAAFIAAELCSGAEDGMRQLIVCLTDANGRIAATDDRELRCEVLGSGEFMGMENGCPHDLTSYASDTRSTYRGRLIVYIRKTGTVSARLSAPGLPPVIVTL